MTGILSAAGEVQQEADHCAVTDDGDVCGIEGGPAIAEGECIAEHAPT